MLRFISDTHQLFHSGADAFVTTELSEALRSCLSFLRSSLDSQEAREKVLVSYSVDLPFIRFSSSLANIYASESVKKVLRSSFSFGFAGVGVTAERSEVVEAPLSSPEFEVRFMRDSILLRGYIKEVTLGSRALPQ